VVTQYRGEPIRVYDVPSGKELPALAAEVPASSRGQFSSDAEVVIAPTTGGAVVWNAGTGKVMHTIPNESGRIVTVHLDEDGTLAVTGSDAGELRVHSLVTGKATGVKRAHVGRISAAAVDPSGKMIATAGEDGVVRFWDARSLHLHREIVGHLREVTSVNFDRAGQRLAACDTSGVFRLWPVYGQGTAVTRVSAPERMPTTLAADREMYRLFAVDGKGGGVVREIKEAREHPVPAPVGAVYTAAALPIKGPSFAAGTDKGHVLVYANTGSDPKSYGRLPAAVRTLKYTPDEKRLLAACDRQLVVWDTGTRAEVFRGVIQCPTGQVSIGASGRWLAYLSGNYIVVIDTATKLSYTLSHEDTPSAVDFTPDEKHLLVGTRGWAVYRYPLAKVEVKQRPLRAERLYHGHSAAVTAFAVSPDGKRLASASADGRVLVWDFESDLLAVTLSTDGERRTPVTRLEFTDDGLGLTVQPEGAPPVAFDGAPMKLLPQPIR
jgi:WD40 repeat protein